MKSTKLNRRKPAEQLAADFDAAHTLLMLSGLSGEVAFRVLVVLIADGLTPSDVAGLFADSKETVQ